MKKYELGDGVFVEYNFYESLNLWGVKTKHGEVRFFISEDFVHEFIEKEYES